jgi:hypothetical protein
MDISILFQGLDCEWLTHWPIVAFSHPILPQKSKLMTFVGMRTQRLT